MAFLSLGEAAERASTSKVDIWRAIREGRLSAQRRNDGGFAIDPAELFRVFETQLPEQAAMEQDAAAATETFGQSETSAKPETAETSDIAVAFAALGAELKGLLGLPVEERTNTEPHQHDAERQRADLTERNAQLAAELAAVRATAEKAIAEYASLAERLAVIAEAGPPLPDSMQSQRIRLRAVKAAPPRRARCRGAAHTVGLSANHRIDWPRAAAREPTASVNSGSRLPGRNFLSEESRLPSLGPERSELRSGQVLVRAAAARVAKPGDRVDIFADTPLVVIFLISLVALSAAAEIGHRLGLGVAGEANVLTLEAAMLGLLALMLSFTFAMAVTRFDARRDAVLKEANAIGIAALRARLLPPPHDAESLRLLRDYVQVRLDVAKRAPAQPELNAAIARSNAI